MNLLLLDKSSISTISIAELCSFQKLNILFYPLRNRTNFLNESSTKKNEEKE